MLYALKIQVSPSEMNLIIDKFIVYSYMIDKKQFLDELNWVKNNDPQSIFTDVSIVIVFGNFYCFVTDLVTQITYIYYCDTKYNIPIADNNKYTYF